MTGAAVEALSGYHALLLPFVLVSHVLLLLPHARVPTRQAPPEQVPACALHAKREGLVLVSVPIIAVPW
jgi:hypothetical protein